VTDAVIREWLATTVEDQVHAVAHGLGFTVEERLSLLYADDGYLGARDSSRLESSTQILAALFRSCGLESNPGKTKAMTCLPGSITTSLSDAAYDCRITGEGLTYQERLREQRR
jgi:hypothetical protein